MNQIAARGGLNLRGVSRAIDGQLAHR